MCRLVTAAVLVLASTFVSGQSSLSYSAPQANGPTLLQGFSGQNTKFRYLGCPVNIFATRQATTQMMYAGTRKLVSPVQGLHLTIDDQGYLEATSSGAFQLILIDSIDVIVTAVSTDARVIPVETSSSDVIRTFHFSRTSSEKGLHDADVWMDKVGAIRWLDVTDVSFTNGTHWHAYANTNCRIVPSNFVLIGRN
jgi:hypothetical protein